jgi:phage shock protein A
MDSARARARARAEAMLGSEQGFEVKEKADNKVSQ